MTNKTYVVIAIIAIIVVVVGAFALTASNSGKYSTNSSHELQTTVTIENGTFNPAELTVKQGTTVTWVVKQDDNAPFMITSNDSGPVEGKFLFMSDHLTNGQNFSYTFNETGTFHYHDMDHMDDEKLTGTIIVQ